MKTTLITIGIILLMVGFQVLCEESYFFSVFMSGVLFTLVVTGYIWMFRNM